MHDAPLPADRHCEAAPLEHLQHRHILGQDFGDEFLERGCARNPDQVDDEMGGDAADLWRCQHGGRQIQKQVAPCRSLGETGVGVGKPVVLLVALFAALAGPVSAREPDVPPSQAVFRAALMRSVRDNEMPVDDTLLYHDIDPDTRAALLDYGGVFEDLIDAARAWEAEHTRPR